ncbi:MAG: TadE/TadG family type IV pilus assembly protein [Nitrosomonas sp.]|nr:TadE/TadG family type IV pilus assembly protein [Nitrosomonas sp.]
MKLMNRSMFLQCGVNKRSVQGAVAVEMALLLALMLVLILGVAEFGRALYQYNTLAKAVRDAARHLSQFNPNDTSDYDEAKEDATCLAVYGNLSCGGEALAANLTTDMISINTITETSSAGVPITLVEVTITGFTFNFTLSPLVFLGGGDQSITFGDIRAIMRQS